VAGKAKGKKTMIYLEKDRKRQAEKRAKKRAEMTKAQLEEHLALEQCRICRYREKKTTTSPPCHKGTSYRCTQTLGKAVKRVQVSLPVSPAKRLCVIEKLAGLPLGTSSPNQRSTALVLK
jgi:hypothetical protein